MEYVDVLDEKGNSTGQKKLRSEVHRDGDWHESIHLWIVNSKNEILIQKRSAEKKNHPNVWAGTIAGHVSSGDDPISTALRETKEELGIELERSEIEHLFRIPQKATINRGTFIDNEFNDVYLVIKDVDINLVELQKEEVVAVQFISLPELEKRAFDKDFLPHPEEYKKLFLELRRRLEK